MARISGTAIAIHTRCLDIAAGISSPLYDALKAVGPITIPNRAQHGLGYFLSRVVVGQQLSIHAARSIWTRIEDAATRAGNTIPHFFDLDCVDVLRTCGVSRNKIKALQCIRAADGEGRLDVDMLRDQDAVDRTEQLLGIWGVGPWTCDMASMFYFKSPDIWPVGDVTVQKTFARLIGRRNLTRAAEKFSPYRSYLALAMWEIVDAPPDR